MEGKTAEIIIRGKDRQRMKRNEIPHRKKNEKLINFFLSTFLTVTTNPNALNLIFECKYKK